MSFSENQVKKILKVFRGIFVFVMIIGIIGFVLAILMSIFLKTNRYDSSSIIFLIGIITAYCLNRGIKYRKEWIPPVLTILFSFSLILSILSASATRLTFNFQVTYYVAIITRLLVWIIQLFGIYFFAKKEVRNFFNNKGTTIF